jgi:hypothetical protein
VSGDTGEGKGCLPLCETRWNSILNPFESLSKSFQDTTKGLLEFSVSIIIQTTPVQELRCEDFEENEGQFIGVTSKVAQNCSCLVEQRKRRTDSTEWAAKRMDSSLNPRFQKPPQHNQEHHTMLCSLYYSPVPPSYLLTDTAAAKVLTVLDP